MKQGAMAAVTSNGGTPSQPRDNSDFVQRCAHSDTQGTSTTFEADAVIFAVGITAMQRLLAATPALAARDDFRRIASLRAIDVIATRLWLDRRVATQFPANVLAGFEGDVGSTYFNLNDLQARANSRYAAAAALRPCEEARRVVAAAAADAAAGIGKGGLDAQKAEVQLALAMLPFALPRCALNVAVNDFQSQARAVQHVGVRKALQSGRGL